LPRVPSSSSAAKTDNLGHSGSYSLRGIDRIDPILIRAGGLMGRFCSKRDWCNRRCGDCAPAGALALQVR
jgi:hypothetical protein